MQPAERLKGIDVFVAVADAGSFTAAADRLSLTNSAVGKAVARLESRLGIKLFERTTRSLTLTDAGEAFLGTCHRVLGDLAEAEQSLHLESATPMGKLRLDLPATYGKLKVMPLVFDFMEQFPAVQPQISFTDHFVDPVENAIDIAVRIGGTDTWPAPVSYKYLGHDRRVFCCSPAYLARLGGIPDSLDVLQELDAVVYRRADGWPSPWFIQRSDGPVERCFPRARLELDGSETLLEAVVRGFGVTQLPTWLLGPYLRSGELVEIMPSFSTQGLPLYLLWLRSRQGLPKVAAMLEQLKNGLEI